MPQQEQTHYHTNRTHPDEEHAAEMDALMDKAIAEAQECRRDRPEVVEHSDEFLDEIDAILVEEEEFALSYRQKGGQ
jgi:uncharacterized coiled-coil DUF342 family protein